MLQPLFFYLGAGNISLGKRNRVEMVDFISNPLRKQVHHLHPLLCSSAIWYDTKHPLVSG